MLKYGSVGHEIWDGGPKYWTESCEYGTTRYKCEKRGHKYQTGTHKYWTGGYGYKKVEINNALMPFFYKLPIYVK